MNDLLPRIVKTGCKTAFLVGVVYIGAIAVSYGGIRAGLDVERITSIMWVVLRIIGTPIALWILADFNKVPKENGEVLIEGCFIAFTSRFLSGVLNYPPLVGWGTALFLFMLMFWRMEEAKKVAQ